MSRFGNVFAPKLPFKKLKLPRSDEITERFHISENGPIQEEFKKAHSGKEGCIFTIDNGHYLDLGKDWKQFYIYLWNLKTENHLKLVEFLTFITGRHYEPENAVDVDAEMMEVFPEPMDGRIYRMRVDVNKRLERYVGQNVKAELKNRTSAYGRLISFDAVSGQAVIKGETDKAATCLFSAEIEDVKKC